MAGSRFQILLLFIAWGQVAAQVSSGAVTSSGPYATGQAPGAALFAFEVGAAANSNGNTVVITASAAIFGADETGISSGAGTIAVTASAGSPPTLTYALSSSGTVLTGTIGGGGFATSTTYYIAVAAAKMASALPAAGAVTCSIVVTGNTVQNSIAVYTIVAAPTVMLTSASSVVGVQPSALAITITLPVATANTQTLTITPSKTLFTGSATSDVSLTGGTMGGTPSVTGFTTGAIVVTSGGSSTIGQTLKLTVAQAGLATLPSTGAVTFDVVHSANTNTLVNDAALFTISAGAAGSDPVARWGNTVREFELPPGELTLLLKTPKMEVFGSVFEGGGSYEQWFDRFVLADVDQTRFVDIKMKKNLVDYNHSKSMPGAFKTIDVTLGIGAISNPSYVADADMNTAIPNTWLGSQIEVRRFQRFAPTKSTSIGNLPRECADVAGEWLHFYICSTPATEYYGSLRHLAMKYAHFDMAVVEMTNHQQVTGLFPELWGLKPMSKTTRAFVKGEEKDVLAGAALTVNDTALNNTGLGAGLEVCTEDCFNKLGKLTA
jgi:hypothetical protein